MKKKLKNIYKKIFYLTFNDLQGRIGLLFALMLVMPGWFIMGAMTDGSIDQYSLEKNLEIYEKKYDFVILFTFFVALNGLFIFSFYAIIKQRGYTTISSILIIMGMFTLNPMYSILGVLVLVIGFGHTFYLEFKKQKAIKC